jgi:hypothetical protein
MRVIAATIIRATPEQVFHFIAVPEDGPRWQESAISTRVMAPGPAAPVWIRHHDETDSEALAHALRRRTG